MEPRSWPETSVNNISLHHVTFQKSEDIVHTATEAGNQLKLRYFMSNFMHFYQVCEILTMRPDRTYVTFLLRNSARCLQIRRGIVHCLWHESQLRPFARRTALTWLMMSHYITIVSQLFICTWLGHNLSARSKKNIPNQWQSCRNSKGNNFTFPVCSSTSPRQYFHYSTLTHKSYRATRRCYVTETSARKLNSSWRTAW